MGLLLLATTPSGCAHYYMYALVNNFTLCALLMVFSLLLFCFSCCFGFVVDREYFRQCQLTFGLNAGILVMIVIRRACVGRMK
jgi:uncharacterized membrane protein YagU involved in acid resistance